MKGCCLECRAEFRGRNDKKFCSDYCRNAYHNRLNRECNNLVRTVNNRLRRNYRILKHLNATRPGRPVRRVHLVDHGFDFRSITRVEMHRAHPCYCVYDLGYVSLGEDSIQIVQAP